MVGVVQGEGRTFYFKRPVDGHTAEIGTARVGTEATGVGLAEVGSFPEGEPALPAIDPVRPIEEEFLPD